MLRIPLTGKVGLSAPEIALVAVTMVWGATFLVIQIAMTHGGPAYFVATRFLAAAVVMALVFNRSLGGLTRTEVFAGSLIGVALAVSYVLQTAGLQWISSSKSAFITALYVPIVPLLQWLVLGKPPRLLSWFGVVLAFIGLALLAGPEALQIGLGVGEVVTLVGAVAIASEIILISRYADRVDSKRITVVQLAACGILSLIYAALSGEPLPDLADGVWLISALGLAIASAVIQFTMNWAQKAVSPTKATLIYAGEPVWAGIVGRLAGDRLPPLAILGAAFIVSGVVVSELKLLQKNRIASNDQTWTG